MDISKFFNTWSALCMLVDYEEWISDEYHNRDDEQRTSRLLV